MYGMTSALALVTDAFGGSGGIAQYNRDFLSALAEHEGVAGITVLPRHTADIASAPAGIDQRKAVSGRLAYAIFAILIAHQRRVDLVFCGHLHLVPLAWVVARLRRAKLIVQAHGIEVWPRPSRLRRAAVDTADLVLCVSRYTRARVCDWTILSPNRVLVVPNTVGAQFTVGDGSRLRSSLGLQDKRVLLTVGRLDPREQYKGHDRVIAMIPQLVTDGFDIIYLVAGQGEDRSRLENLARALGVADRVRFLGALDRECLVEAYRTADLFIMPSTGEGFGIAFLEAMASGTPALGLASCGAVDALADGEFGLAVSEADLVAGVLELLKASKPDPNVLSANVRRRFGRAAFCARVHEVLERVFPLAETDGRWRGAT